MNENIDLTKILKDCPKGWKFYSNVLGEVEFICIASDIYKIKVEAANGEISSFTSKGKYRWEFNGECTLFPSKYQRDWSKFSAPWYNPEKQDEDKKERNNFDVLPGLYKCVHRMFDGTPEGRLLFEIGNVYKCVSKHDRAEFEVSYGHSVYLEDPVVCKYFIPFERKVEQASSQTNERAWLYLVSDVLTWKDGIGQYLDDTRVQELAKRLCSEYAQKLYIPSNSSNTRNNEQKSADKIEPKFKVGDRVRHKETNKDDVYEISKVYDDSYGIAGFTWMIYMKYQDQYELVPNKFDPKNLKPFDEVLVFDSNTPWTPLMFTYLEYSLNYPRMQCFDCVARKVIPYNKETEHLLGTYNEAPEYYRYWED